MLAPVFGYPYKVTPRVPKWWGWRFRLYGFRFFTKSEWCTACPHPHNISMNGWSYTDYALHRRKTFR